MTLRESARAVFDAAMGAGDVGPLVRRALADVQPPQGRVIVVGAGKASGAMAAAIRFAFQPGGPLGPWRDREHADRVPAAS